MEAEMLALARLLTPICGVAFIYMGVVNFKTKNIPKLHSIGFIILGVGSIVGFLYLLTLKNLQ